MCIFLNKAQLCYQRLVGYTIYDEFNILRMNHTESFAG